MDMRYLEKLDNIIDSLELPVRIAEEHPELQEMVDAIKTLQYLVLELRAEVVRLSNK